MYPVDLHTHTVASTHAYSTLQEYIAMAKQKGIRLFATTDHGPEMDDAPHAWHFINCWVLPRIIEGIGILHGIEANIKNSAGDIDCSERMLNQLDIVLAGFHDPVFQPVDQQTHTRAMINAMRSGKVHVITHPGNPRFPIDIERVVEAAVQYQVALEINNSSLLYSRPGSRPNCQRIVEVARDQGAWIVCNSDAHIAHSLGEVAQSVGLLQQSNFPPERVLNRSPAAVLDFLQQRGKPAIAEFAQLFT